MYKTIDLFAGIGGIRRGFEKTKKFKNVLSAEIDKYACMTYEHLYKENPYNDVTTEEFKEKVEKLDYDILLAGFPCQAFSLAGKREGFLDKTRGTLFFDVADIIRRSRPKAFLLENVKGLLTHKKGETFEIIINTLVKELNYRVVGVKKDSSGNLIYDNSDFLRIATDFGVPQKRERVYIVGFNEEIVKNKKLQSLPLKREKKEIYKNLNDLLDLKNEAKYYLSEGGLETLEKHRSFHSNKGNGFGYEIVNDSQIENPIANTILATGGSGKERNLVYDPQDEVIGMIVKGKKTKINDKGIRFMTPREWGKLQGFINYAFLDENRKENFSFPKGVSETQQYKQFGNSVCIPVIEELAEYIYKTLEQFKNKNFNELPEEEIIEDIKYYNKGEWSEIYVFLKGLVDGKFFLKDSEKNSLNLYHKINKIFRNSNDNTKEKIFEPENIEKNVYEEEMKYLFQEIINKKGTFSISRIEKFSHKQDFSLSKGKSNEKSDLKAEIEFEKNTYPEVYYSIKSKIKSSPTLLNASAATNFEYEVTNLSISQIEEINEIGKNKTPKDKIDKIKDRMKKIKEYEGKINFIDVPNNTFSDNLKYIDADIKVILAELLLAFCSSNKSTLPDLVKIVEEKNICNINLKKYPRFYKDKIIKFLFEATFNMMPSKPIKSSLNLNFGGILCLINTGEVYLVDNLVYKHLGDYLFNNLKLETPSTSRYHMLEIKNGKFTLNLQIRFI